MSTRRLTPHSRRDEGPKFGATRGKGAGGSSGIRGPTLPWGWATGAKAQAAGRGAVSVGARKGMQMAVCFGRVYSSRRLGTWTVMDGWALLPTQRGGEPREAALTLPRSQSPPSIRGSPCGQGLGAPCNVGIFAPAAVTMPGT